MRAIVIATLLVFSQHEAAADASVGPKVHPETQRRMREWKQLLDELTSLVSACHAVGSQAIRGRTSVVLPADCFFAPGNPELRANAKPLVATVATALKHLKNRDVWVCVHAVDKQPRAWRLTSAQAVALVEALIAAGVPEHQLSAVGFADQNGAEVYDGPSALAPGNALIELSLVPNWQELPAP